MSLIAWFKVDDGFHSSRKLLSIPKRYRLSAAGLWVIAGSWCADQLTDGHVPEYMLKEWGATPATVAALVDSGLWEHVSGAHVFCNWHEYQPSKRDVDLEREAQRARMQQLRARRREQEPQNNAASEDLCGRTPPHGAENVRNPVPSRPDPTPTPNGVGRARETQLPKSWEPTKEHHDRAHESGLDISREQIKFASHAEEKGRKAKNWNAAFTRWLINAAEYAERDNARGAPILDRQGEVLRQEMIRAKAADAANTRLEIQA